MSKSSRRRKRSERRQKARKQERQNAALSISGMPANSKGTKGQQQAQATLVAALRQEVRQEVRQFSGPLPPPEILREYNEVLPGSAERILVLLEKQTNHRTELEKKVLADENKRSWGGLIAGFIIALVCLVGGILLVKDGHDTAGTTIATASVASLAGVFVIGGRMRSQERVQKMEILTGKKET